MLSQKFNNKTQGLINLKKIMNMKKTKKNWLSNLKSIQQRVFQILHRVILLAVTLKNLLKSRKKDMKRPEKTQKQYEY